VQIFRPPPLLTPPPLPRARLGRSCQARCRRFPSPLSESASRLSRWPCPALPRRGPCVGVRAVSTGDAREPGPGSPWGVPSRWPLGGRPLTRTGPARRGVSPGLSVPVGFWAAPSLSICPSHSGSAGPSPPDEAHFAAVSAPCAYDRGRRPGPGETSIGPAVGGEARKAADGSATLGRAD
jgi:hypothetical protein